jgi:Sulfotransferase domain
MRETRPAAVHGDGKEGTKGSAMSVRQAAGPLRRIGRRAYRRVTTATASHRLEPGFIIIGAQRCGTTSLFQALAAHPQLMRPLFHKGINYFDLNYCRGPEWYRSHFPLAEIARRKAAPYGLPVAFEASGYYLYHPFALQRLGGDLPRAKLVAMVRNPAERAFSAYKHEYARGFEQESFERALELEDERLAGEIERMRDDPAYESLSHRHHSYRHRGHYAEQFERVLAFFPRTQLCVIDSEAFFSQPGVEYRRLLAFLGLHPFEPARFDRHNAREGAPMASQTRRMLEEYFAPHDERLTRLLGRPLYWRR